MRRLRQLHWIDWLLIVGALGDAVIVWKVFWG